MSRNILIALILIALVVVLLLINAGDRMTLDLLITEWKRASTSMVLLGFTGLGVIIGILLR
jgi:type IV secretory pathway VirB3-like protein